MNPELLLLLLSPCKLGADEKVKHQALFNSIYFKKKSDEHVNSSHLHIHEHQKGRQ
jgi:hypothetical protein